VDGLLSLKDDVLDADPGRSRGFEGKATSYKWLAGSSKRQKIGPRQLEPSWFETRGNMESDPFQLLIRKLSKKSNRMVYSINMLETQVYRLNVRNPNLRSYIPPIRQKECCAAE